MIGGLLRLPSEVRFGRGERGVIATLVRRYGRRVFVVTDPALEGTAAFVEMARSLRESGASVEIHTAVPAEVPIDAIDAAAARARVFAPDVIVGYGGGTALDAAKLIALVVVHGGPLDRYYGENLVPGPVLPIIAVPTTAGTGSEVTPVAVTADPARELKVGISSPHLIPRAAVVDPELTVGAPANVVRFAGADAFVHAVECYTARALSTAAGEPTPVFVGRNVLADPLALEAATLIHRSLVRVLEDEDDARARDDLARGSLLAGMAFGASGTHASHAVQYAVGARTHTPHGLGTGTLLPYTLELCAAVVPERVARLGAAIGTAGTGNVRDDALATVDDVAAFCERIGLPSSLAALGLVEDDLSHIVALTTQVTRLLALSPFPTTDDVVTTLVHAAVTGDRASLRAFAAHTLHQERP